MNRTSIEWTDYTSNLIRYRDPEGRSVHGCIKVSAGCANCYASAWSARGLTGERGGAFTAKRQATAPGAARGEDTMKHNLGPHQFLLLDFYGQAVLAAWGEPGYLVGSSQRGEPWRDIDVRVMLDDAVFERRFSGASGDRHASRAWRAEMLAWSTLGERMTGLPIDFQVEPISEANRINLDGPRNPIGLGGHWGRLP